MARKKTSLVERTVVQIDRAFWCIHDHLDVMVPLGLPTCLAMFFVALVLVGIWQTWTLPGWMNYLLIAIVVPELALLIFTVLSLPCAVFAWRRASGEVPTARQCFAACTQRGWRLAWVVFRLALLWLFSFVLFGIPLMVIWPRTCLTPLIALFEDQRKVFRRSRRILGEDVAVYVIGGIYLAIALVLGFLIFLPRLLIGTQMLGAHLMDAQWRRLVLDYLWIFEGLSAALVLTALSMSWWISLTLLYHEVRWAREGEDLRQKILQLRGKIVETVRP
jgi:hypothetical protein